MFKIVFLQIIPASRQVPKPGVHFYHPEAILMNDKTDIIPEHLRCKDAEYGGNQPEDL